MNADCTSIVSDGVVVLHYMPQAVYVKIDDSDQVFLTADQRGVLAVTPQARPWTFKPAAGGPAIAVSRTQLTVLPRKQGTLHGIQGKTADPGFIVHWTFPPGLKKESLWLAYYVSLSRPRSFAQLLSHGLPDRGIIEAGPPGKDRAGLRRALRGQDCHHKDRLRESPTGAGLACTP